MLRNELLPVPLFRFSVSAWRLLQTDCWHTAMAAASSAIAIWRERARSRRVLATLDDHRLRDIGVSRADAWLESEKPFWIP